MSIYKIFSPVIFLLKEEKAHNLAISFLRFLPNFSTLFALNKNYPNLQNKVFNINFSNPIGMAAGFDKNAEVAGSLQRFGFGFIEVGTVTPKAQKGNEKPRIFRLKKDKAIINRLGFNNLGAKNFEQNIELLNNKISCPLGINIGKNKDQKDPLKDYLKLLDLFFAKASYITVNISSPNTKNLRDLQGQDQLDLFLQGLMKKKKELVKKHNKNIPILLKIAPDLSKDEQKNIAKTVLKNKVDGVIISNTTIDRDLNLQDGKKDEIGGLSGVPLREKSNEVLRNFYQETKGKIPLIGVGGIANAQDVLEKIKNGASLVQIYSAFIFEGFGLVEKIKKDLSHLLKEDGFENISQAIGKNVK